MLMAAPIPSADREAMSVMFFSQFLGSLAVGPLSFGCPPVQRREGDVGAALVHEDELVRIEVL
jgi:hypothetical protein